MAGIPRRGTTYKRVCREIETMQAKLSQRPVTENFGRAEVSKLREKYNLWSLQDICDMDERNQILSMVDEFDNWCATYGGFGW